MAELPILLLLPPSEGKADGGDVKTPWSPTLGATSKEVSTARKVIADTYSKSSGVRVVKTATMLATDRYTGVVWKHLDLASLPVATRRKLQKQIYVVSGLLGLVRGDESIPNYKLKMGARLAPIGSLASFWKPVLTVEVAKLGQKHLLVDLLPNEHRAAIDWNEVPNHVQIDLVAKDGGRVGGHNAKAAKGLLARHILTTNSDLKSAIRSFRNPEYSAKLTIKDTK
jgi:uncharacterized protein